MAIEKGLYSAPEGMEEFEQAGVDAVIDMEVMSDEPIQIEMEDGSVEISFGEEVEEADMAPFDANLAEYLDDG
jgi:aldehyde:ferredoxin oxidoreductase